MSTSVDEKDLERLVNLHLKAHDGLQLQDVYKLLYQGVFGPEHLLHHPEKARSYLQEEWLSLQPWRKDEPLIEPVSLDGKMVRVNLRPYKTSGKSWEALWEVFLTSAKASRPEVDKFAELWQRLLDLCLKEKIPFSPQEVAAMGEEMACKSYPALHHSSDYQRNNYPGYRVVLYHEFDKMLQLKK